MNEHSTTAAATAPSTAPSTTATDPAPILAALDRLRAVADTVQAALERGEAPMVCWDLAYDLAPAVHAIDAAFRVAVYGH